MQKTWIATVEEDAWGEPILVFPDGCLPDDWVEGTTIEWIDQKDGTWLLRKKGKKMEQTKFTLVECVSTFRMRYVAEVPVGTDDWAADIVVMNEAKEFSQEHIGEQIISQRDLTREEVLELCDVDNHYCKAWSEEQKINAFVTQRKDYE